MNSTNGLGFSVDAVVQDIADIEADRRALDWAYIDYVAGTVDAAVEAGMTKTEAANLVGSCAGRSGHWAKLWCRLSESFPAEYRYPTLDIIVYREALGADDPLAAVIMAHDNQWSAKELRAWIDQGKGKRERPVVKVEGVMNWQQGDIHISPDRYLRVELDRGLKDVRVIATVEARN